MTPNERFLPYGRQCIDEQDIEAVATALRSEMITRGERVAAFEKSIAEYCGAQHAVAFNSGSSALLATCYAAKVNASDRVLTTPNTFFSTTGCAAQFGATPVFIDIDRQTGNLDLELLEMNLGTPLSRGRHVIMPVHFSGIAVDMEKVDRMITDPDAVVIEDAAHALGSCYRDGQKVGSCAWSQMTVFSFHPVKNITTGEGGMVTTNDDQLAHRLRQYRNNGIEREKDSLKNPAQAAPWYYEVQGMSNNLNFTEIQAALGLSQMSRLDEFVKRRRQLIGKYREKLAGFPHLKMFTSEFDAQTAFHLCVVQIDFDALGINRAEVMYKLVEKGIGTQVHYIPVYRHPVFQEKSGDLSAYFPQMEGYYAQALSLPLFYGMTDLDLERVCSTLKTVLKV